MLADSTAYPPAPWILRGFAYGRVSVLDSESVGRQLPAGFQVVNCWPGRTIGGIVAAQYGEESTLQYSELIVFAGLVRCRTEIGLWVSRILVDSDESIAGGREIWGLPKERARFDWSRDSCTVRQDGQVLYRLVTKNLDARFPFAFSFPTFTIIEGSPAVFKSRVGGRFVISSPTEIGDLLLSVEAPTVIDRP